MKPNTKIIDLEEKAIAYQKQKGWPDTDVYEAYIAGFEAGVGPEAEAHIQTAGNAQIEIMALRSTLRDIADLGVYCCDYDSLGHECEAVRMAKEVLE